MSYAPQFDGASDLLYRLAMYVILGALILITVTPFIIALSTSFKTESEFFGNVYYLIPREYTLEWWKSAFSNMAPSLWNSVKVASGTAVLSLLITIPGAYAFGRKEFPGRKPLFYGILIALLFPYIILIIPIADLWNDLGLYNTIFGLWIAYQAFVTPFAIWILRDFFERMPQNLEEAAQVYGLTQFRAFVRVILPLSMPAIAAVGFLAFLTGWNDFLFSNMLTTSTGPQPGVVYLFSQSAGMERTFWGTLMSQTLIIGTPPLVLYIIARRQLQSAFVVE